MSSALPSLASVELKQVDEIAEAFMVHWVKLISTPIDPSNKNSFTLFFKRKLSVGASEDVEEYLMDTFMNLNSNVFQLHLLLIDVCLRVKKPFQDKQLGILFLNKTFENWLRQQQNRVKKNNAKNGAHLLATCTQAAGLVNYS